MALQRTGATGDRWFDDYLALCLERDLLELGRVRRPAALAPLKHASWMQHRPHVGHWRTHDGAEVDLVIEDGRDGSVVGIEVKASTRVHPADRRGLRKLRDALGERFSAGVVFHTGPHCVRYADDERIVALPVDRPWSGAEA